MNRNLDELGRITLPIEMRKELNIERGEKVHIELEENKITISKPNLIDYKKIINELKLLNKELKEDNDKYEEKFINDLIEKNEEEIYEKYCEIYPEKITSDFQFEDIDDVNDFVKNYMNYI